MKKPAGSRKVLFISSVQKEFKTERRVIRDYVRSDPLLKRFFDVFLFEDLPASDRKTDEIYLEEVGRSDIYIGLFGDEYGPENSKGVSPTEREFSRATSKGIPRLIFIKGTDDTTRHPKMMRLIRKAGSQLIRRRFGDTDTLTAELYAAIVEYMEQNGDLRIGSFDASACPRATMEDISQEAIQNFLETAKRERKYKLPVKTAREKALAHLDLLDGGNPTYAAVLLFAKAPQHFLPTSEIKCMHFHGTSVRKPIPSYHIYKGTVFELVDQAADFVLSKINRHIGTREHGVQAPATYELPEEVVTEAIVNAVAHRDYASKASVQVMLFADRLEVWNPGVLPPALTPERLREPHASIPRNPLIAEPLYLARYIEKAGSGTLDMIERCGEAGLPSPDFEERSGLFVVTAWRDWLTDPVMDRLGLNENERKLVALLKAGGRITNLLYQEKFGVSKPTASRHLELLASKGVLQKVGTTGKGTFYILSRKRLTKGSMDS